jgi:hypothetical protein
MTRSFRALLLLFTALASGCQWSRQAPITGVVNVSPDLLGKAQSPNAVLFVVARNLGGVPVAVREIVNPAFPYKFSIGPEDLILPGAWTSGLTVTARLATRLGPDGLPASDIEETRAIEAKTGGETVRLYLDTAIKPAWSTAKLVTPRTNPNR